MAMTESARLSWSALELAKIIDRNERTIIRLAHKKNWLYDEILVKGGIQKRYHLSSLPAHYQTAVVKQCDDITELDYQYLCPDAQLEARKKLHPQGSMLSVIQSKEKETIKEGDTWNEDVARKEMIIQEALNVPVHYKKSAWIDLLAIKHDLNRATIYKWIKKRQKAGLAGLKHSRSTKDKSIAWTPDALEYWIGLVLKREHRKFSKKDLYRVLQEEARQHGWRIGSYPNALYWLDKRVTPQLLALQKGGIRALDNLLPPISRKYFDLRPFEILVGDQHRFDFWVRDDVTGQVFRPEGYLWQDLRTRLFYGGALDKKYNSYLIGLALRIGVQCFGMFEKIYTDNGRPELSHYIEGILRDKGKAFSTVEGIDIPVDPQIEPEEIRCHITENDHTKAIVKNAKAKMIEGTFNVLEGILRNHLGVPGYVKRLSSSGEEQDTDQAEAEKLASSGKLLTFTEFTAAFYQALDYYNKEKPHRGVLREWLWKPKPKQATPLDCIKACMEIDGWRPTPYPSEAADMLFLPKAIRTVDRGRIRFNDEFFEHEKLMQLHQQKVEIRFDPLELDALIVFYKGECLCKALPIEYSSMKDKELARRKIEEKRRIRKIHLEYYHRLTSCIPDVRNYSTTPVSDKSPALIGSSKKKEGLEDLEYCRELPQEEHNRILIERMQPKVIEEPEVEEPQFFATRADKFYFLLEHKIRPGKVLNTEQVEFIRDYYVNKPSEDQRLIDATFKALGLVDYMTTLLGVKNDVKEAIL